MRTYWAQPDRPPTHPGPRGIPRTRADSAVNRTALAAGIEAIKDNEWTKRVIEHNTLWSKKIFSALKEFNIKTNEPTANFFLMNFDETKINSDEAFEKLANKKLILRKLTQYKIPNSLRLTIGNKEVNEHFVKSLGSILK